MKKNERETATVIAILTRQSRMGLFQLGGNEHGNGAEQLELILGDRRVPQREKSIEIVDSQSENLVIASLFITNLRK